MYSYGTKIELECYNKHKYQKDIITIISTLSTFSPFDLFLNRDSNWLTL